MENVLAVTSAALALGFTAEQVADGLRTFSPGENNPGPDEHLDASPSPTERPAW